jgi:predicted RNA-binding protein
MGSLLQIIEPHIELENQAETTTFISIMQQKKENFYGNRLEFHIKNRDYMT